MNLKDFIRSIPDYPKKGILFRDITTLIKDEKAFSETINQIVERSKKIEFNKIAAVESRGFVFASAISYRGARGGVGERFSALSPLLLFFFSLRII